MGLRGADPVDLEQEIVGEAEEREKKMMLQKNQANERRGKKE